jgi:hypothetical protein
LSVRFIFQDFVANIWNNVSFLAEAGVKGVRFFFFSQIAGRNRRGVRRSGSACAAKDAPGAADDRAKEERLGFSSEFGFAGILSLAQK